MNSALIVQIIIVILKIRFSSCGLRDLGEVRDVKHSSDSKSERCLMKPVRGAVPLQENRITSFGLGITGGQKASNFDFPHSVIFINYGGVCAGTIISDKLVLSSAHCLDFNKNKKEMAIHAGARFLFDRNADVHYIQDYAIHDRYNIPIRFANDAVLLKIQDRFRFSPIIKPALLVKNDNWMVRGAVVKVAGWGERSPGTAKISEELKSVDLNLLSRSECKKTAGTSLSPDMFCLWGDGNRASCLGDSGGGTFWNNMLVGIVSHGGACGLFPGVYTNVVHLRSWITQTSRKLNANLNRF